ncbi:MAG: ribulose-phosphate 3-epimerase [Deltaproteobacteria bacterium]|nr:ribulose-phosphate 3-epimerase [Deltaproteobacteria bacterium]
MKKILLAPSILSADFMKLEEEIETVADMSDYLHMDVMDGHFVQNITFGPDLVSRVARKGIPLDVHLMISEPSRWIEKFADAGSSIITIHVETDVHIYKTLTAIKDRGILAGVSLNPGTSPERLNFLMDVVDLILIMSVNPGFGGQKFISSSVEKIARVQKMVEKSGRNIIIEVDGGVDHSTAKIVCNAGADMLVAGSAIFGKENRKEAAKAILASCSC